MWHLSLDLSENQQPKTRETLVDSRSSSLLHRRFTLLRLGRTNFQLLSSECAFTLNGYECESDVTFALEITQCERTLKGFFAPYIHICPFRFSSTIYVKHSPLNFEEIISVKPDRRALSSYKIVLQLLQNYLGT